MATLTIIKDDKFVSVDGVGLILDAVVLPANVHAIQWDGSAGWVEYNDGTANVTIDSISAYSTITDDHATKKTANETAAAKAVSDKAAADKLAQDEQTALHATYGWKRQYDETTSYASVGDQLDQQYKDAVNGTTTWKDGIAAVKAAHPKP